VLLREPTLRTKPSILWGHQALLAVMTVHALFHFNEVYAEAPLHLTWDHGKPGVAKLPRGPGDPSAGDVHGHHTLHHPPTASAHGRRNTAGNLEGAAAAAATRDGLGDLDNLDDRSDAKRQAQHGQPMPRVDTFNAPDGDTHSSDNNNSGPAPAYDVAAHRKAFEAEHEARLRSQPPPVENAASAAAMDAARRRFSAGGGATQSLGGDDGHGGSGVGGGRAADKDWARADAARQRLGPDLGAPHGPYPAVDPGAAKGFRGDLENLTPAEVRRRHPGVFAELPLRGFDQERFPLNPCWAAGAEREGDGGGSGSGGVGAGDPGDAPLSVDKFDASNPSRRRILAPATYSNASSSSGGQRRLTSLWDDPKPMARDHRRVAHDLPGSGPGGSLRGPGGGLGGGRGRGPMPTHADEVECLPAVYLLGLPKCGSSDLWERLALHPQV